MLKTIGAIKMYVNFSQIGSNPLLTVAQFGGNLLLTGAEYAFSKSLPHAQTLIKNIATTVFAGVGTVLVINSSETIFSILSISSPIAAGTQQVVGGLIRGFEQAVKGNDWAISGATEGFFGSTIKGVENAVVSNVGAIEATLQTINGSIAYSIFTNYVTLGVASTALLAGSFYGVKYTYERLKHNIGKPALALKMRQYSWLSELNPFKARATEKAPEPIFNPEITRRLKEIIATTTNIKNNRGYFQNVLLWGPGGTGKTMISEMMANNSDMNFVMMSGGQLGQFIKRGEHVSEVIKLFKTANSSSKPTMIFIDECEALCKDRAKGLDLEHTEILDTFLNLTGAPSKKIMLVMATNRIEDLDPAALSRLDHKIYIGPPGLEQRSKIISMYAKQFFEEFPEELVRFFSQEKTDELASKTEGFTGRAIFKLLNSIVAKKMQTADNKLTDNIIEETLNDVKKDEAEIEEIRLRKESVGNPNLLMTNKPVKPNLAVNIPSRLFGFYTRVNPT